jgi:hypothetical protein
MTTSRTFAGPIPLLDRFQRVGSAIPIARRFVLLAVQLRGDHRLLALLWWVELAVHMAASTSFTRDTPSHRAISTCAQVQSSCCGRPVR